MTGVYLSCIPHHLSSNLASIFLLLEQRNYAGEHVIHQIAANQDRFKVHTRMLNPGQVDKDLRKDIFGSMDYDAPSQGIMAQVLA